MVAVARNTIHFGDCVSLVTQPVCVGSSTERLTRLDIPKVSLFSQSSSINIADGNLSNHNTATAAADSFVNCCYALLGFCVSLQCVLSHDNNRVFVNEGRKGLARR